AGAQALGAPPPKKSVARPAGTRLQSYRNKMNDTSDAWPSLPFTEWQDTATTLHMWTQIVGKIRLTLSPWTNHSWHVTLYVTSRGLTTSPIPHGTSTFEIRFDF